MQLIHCEMNIDTANAGLRFTDGAEISLCTPGADDEICPTVPMQIEID
ncbi:MAG: DUF6061 family protein [Clostridiales bacterium]|nr:DUF6061 family protein [Clostridiales bacterium]